MHRIVKIGDQIVLDAKQTISARGIYICKDKTCHDKITKQKVLNRAFRQNIDSSQYDELLKQIRSTDDKQSES